MDDKSGWWIMKIGEKYMLVDKYEYNRKDINFIKKYTGAKNASSASEVDANANVESKNITTMGAEIHKKDNIYTNRLMMYDKIKELYDEDLAEEYLRQLESHEIYRHDEAGAIVGTPYCASISMYPFLLNGLKTIGGKSGVPRHLRSFCGGFINLVFAVSSQLAGACSTPEFISYLDYFIRKEYGDDYYLKTETVINNIGDIKTIGDVIDACFDQVVYSINQPAAARGYQCVTEDTELWTPNGFKHLNELNVGDSCYVWKNGKFLEEKIKKINVYDYDGKLVEFSGQNYKQTVTPNHRVLYKKCNTNEYDIKEAKDLVGHSKLSLPVSGDIDRKDYPISDDQLKLCVYALTDGSIDNNRLNFYMSKNRNGYNDLIYSLNSLGVGYTEYNKKQLFGNVSTIRLSSVDAASTLRFIKYTKSEIPHFFKLLSKRQAELVINCWGNTDGSVRNGKYMLQCDSIKIAKDLQEVVLLSGRGSTIKTETRKKIIKNESCQTTYVSTFNRNTKRISSYNSVSYSGKVWCPTTNAGVVIFRENNSTPYISGNSVFWNIAYFDKNYFKQLFGEFVFPDGTPMVWDSVNWLQKRFMVWFNKERTKEILTFPVETVSLLDDGTDYVDKEWKDFVAEMYANGHSFFTYRSNSVDSLASCCFSGDTMVLVKSSSGVMYKTFDELANQTPYLEKKNLTVFHNGSWISAKTVKLPKKNMYRIDTVNGKELFLTEDHICVTDSGEKLAKNISENDYMMFSTLPLNSFPEVDRKLTYEQGFFIGMYLGDGSMSNENSSNTTTIHLSLNEQKYNCSINIIKKAILDCDSDAEYKLGKPYNNVYPTTIRSNDLAEFIRSFVSGSYCFEKELNLNCLLQSLKFRQGILDGYYATDGGNSNRIYTTSEKLCGQIECLMTSLGLISVLSVSDRTDEVGVIRGQSFTRNYPLYCIRWYDRKNKRNIKDLYKVINNCTYFKVRSIQPAEYEDDFVYCFEVDREEEPYFTLPNGIITHNCRLRNEFTDNTFSYTLGAGGVSTGSKCVMTINMNRLVQNATKNGVDIKVAVKEQTDKLHKYLTAFNEILKEMKNLHMIQIYDAGFIAPQKQYLTIGINGLVEGAEFLGIKISPNKEYEAYVKSIFETIYTQNKLHKTKELMFNTEQVPAENLGIKNAKWDKKDGYFVPRDCYNSYIYLVEDDSINILDKFMMHGGEFTSKLDGGCALHANLEEHLTKDQYIKLLEVAINTGCSYFTFNIPNTICNDCSNISKHKLKVCPKCGSVNLDYAVRIIGYLKRVSSFSDGRQIEESKRVYH